MVIFPMNQFWALIGSILLCFALILSFKATKDRGSKRTWFWFWGDKWDDMAGTLVFGQVVTLFMHQMFGLYIYFIGSEEDWGWFIDAEEFIAFSIGIFGMAIFLIFYKKTKKYLRTR